jgi:hypothetical protein
MLHLAYDRLQIRLQKIGVAHLLARLGAAVVDASVTDQFLQKFSGFGGQRIGHGPRLSPSRTEPSLDVVPWYGYTMTRNLTIRLPDDVAPDVEVVARVEGKNLNETVKQSLIEAVERRRTTPSSRRGRRGRLGRPRVARMPGYMSVEYPYLADYLAIAAKVTGLDLKTHLNATELTWPTLPRTHLQPASAMRSRMFTLLMK